MAITGIDTIEGKQIIAAGAVSAKSAEMAYNDENGNPITGKLDASASGSLPYAHYHSTTHAIVEDGITASPNYLALSGFLTAVPSQISADNLLGVNAGTLTTPQLTADRNGVNATGKGFISTNSTGTASLTYASGLNIVDNGQGRSASIDGLSGININLANASASVNYSGLNIKHTAQGREISISATNGGKVYIDDKGASGLDGYGNVNWQVGGPAKQLVNAGGDPQPGIIMAPAPTSVSAQWTAMTRVSGNNTGLWAYAGPTANAPYAQFMGQNISIEFAPTNAHAGIGVGDVTAGIYTANNDPDKITWSLTGSVQKREIECDTATSAITAIAGSAIGGGGSAPTYSYTDNGLISAIDSSGLYATSALEAKSANALINGGRLGYDVYAVTGVGTNSMTLMILNPQTTPFGNTSGIYSPLYYAQGACMTYGSSAGNTQYFGGFFKGNEWYISNATAGQALRGETHASRGVHVSGATTAGYGFNLAIGAVSGVNSTGSWKYGYQEDAALRAVSSCDMHESAFEYDANDKISGYNGSAFAGGSDVPEGVMVESGLEYNAVNEISGYNGSAIAQYGAEKQLIVHDDTLCHLSNSAQYALGVNLSAVAQLLGVDETVLWESDTTAGKIISDGIDLSETMNNFKEVKFVYRNGINYAPVDYISPHSALVTFNFVHAGGGTNSWMQWSQFSAINNGTKIYMTKCKALNYGNATSTGNVVITATTANDLFYLYQVVGIGRKEV